MDWLGLAALISKIIDKILPDKAAADKAKAELLVLQVNGELNNIASQLAVNAEEAKHKSIFVSGWRPFVGWGCGLGFVFQVLIAPLIVFGGGILGVVIPMPPLDYGLLTTTLFGLLGLGGMRSFEKLKGVNK